MSEKRLLVKTAWATGGAAVCGLLLLGPLHLQATSQADRQALQPVTVHTPVNATTSPASRQRAILDQYCVTCHNERQKTAGLMLDKVVLERAGDYAPILENVVKKLRAGAMPPAGARRPDKATTDSLVAWLEDSLDRAAETRTYRAQPVVHRLNRLEYTNAVRDLLGLEIDGPSLFPTDESGYGFDNIADVLSITPGLLDRYMVVAQRISGLAVPDVAMRATKEKYSVSPYLVQQDRVSDDLPIMSRGGSAFRHYFPVDGEYVLRVGLRRAQQSGIIEGLDNQEQLDVRLDGARLKLFTVGGACVDSKEPRCIKVANSFFRISDYERTADEALQLRFSAKAGQRVVGVAFASANTMTEGAGPPRPPQGRSNSMSVATVEVEGPINATGPGDTPSRRQIFVCQPTATSAEEACAKTILSTLARRAYRRPVTDHDVQSLLRFYRIGRSKGSFETGIRTALQRLLVSPSFLLRIEGTPQESLSVRPASARPPSRITDIELASRLSFFLWSSIPDEELMDVAANGRLSDPAVLERQVRRMLHDSRADTLVSNFAAQWLHLRNLRTHKPDLQVFPDFDDSLRAAFERETEMFIQSQLREDRSVVELLTAKYTFVNERLARFYGIPNVYGTFFRRVDTNDPNRVGLLGHASILTVTSYSTRTSPTIRGKYLLSNILGAPPAPPPPNVPALKDNSDEGESPTTVRARLEAHRKNPVCAACHAQMDPLGLALENFTAIGKWRAREAGIPIDATGVLPNGTKFSNPAEFHEILLSRRAEFVLTFTDRLLTYALGRGVDYYDMPALRAILRNSAPSDYRWSAIILEIVKSGPFLGARPHVPVAADKKAN